MNKRRRRRRHPKPGGPVPGWQERIHSFVRRRAGRPSRRGGREGILSLILDFFARGRNTPRPSEWVGRGCFVARTLCARCGQDKGFGKMVEGFDAYIPSCLGCEAEVRRVEREAEAELAA